MLHFETERFTLTTKNDMETNVNATTEPQHDAKLPVSGSVSRYPMTYDQPCQIDCRVTSCMFYKGDGKCENVSPAITLNENGRFVCWTQADR